jgi:hypothetical protein
MSKITVEASDVIDARPEVIWNVLADYRVGHPAIVPKPYFTDIIVEKGGYGEGTLVLTKMTVYGRKFSFHQLVTEPEPGRLLLETDIDTGQFSSFTLEPLNGGAQTRVTIKAVNPTSAGLMGVMERLTQPSFMRRLFKQELLNLADYVRTEQGAALAS